jgi:hypothetical protein
MTSMRRMYRRMDNYHWSTPRLATRCSWRIIRFSGPAVGLLDRRSPGSDRIPRSTLSASAASPSVVLDSLRVSGFAVGGKSGRPHVPYVDYER